MLTYRNYRAEFEREVLNIMINQSKSFSFQDIFKSLRNICDESIPNDYLADIVCVSLEFCLSQDYIKHYDENSYAVSILNRDKFVAFANKLNDKDFSVKNTL